MNLYTVDDIAIITAICSVIIEPIIKYNSLIIPMLAFIILIFIIFVLVYNLPPNVKFTSLGL